MRVSAGGAASIRDGVRLQSAAHDRIVCRIIWGEFPVIGGVGRNFGMFRRRI